MKLSIVIPAYNEAASIGTLVTYLVKHSDATFKEIIVVDGGSTDDTCNIAGEAGALSVISPLKGRSAQMNYGARIASGNVLYFIHADCFPPSTYVNDIRYALDKGFDLGRYRTKFDSSKWMLKVNAWFTRFDLFMCMGGDQTLFVTKLLFENYKGFKDDMQIMEEFEFCERVRKEGKYIILNGEALISARKYDTNSWLIVQLANAAIVRMYKKGASQQAMVDKYKRLLRYR